MYLKQRARILLLFLFLGILIGNVKSDEELVYVMPTEYQYSYNEVPYPGAESISIADESGVDYHEFMDGMKDSLSDIRDTLMAVPENVGSVLGSAGHMIGKAGNMISTTIMKQYEQMRHREKMRQEEERKNMPIVKIGKPITIKDMVNYKKKYIDYYEKEKPATKSLQHENTNNGNYIKNGSPKKNITLPNDLLALLQQHGIQVPDALGTLKELTGQGLNNGQSTTTNNNNYNNDALVDSSIAYNSYTKSKSQLPPPVVYFNNMAEPIETIPSVLQHEYSYHTIEPVSTIVPFTTTTETNNFNNNYYRWSPNPNADAPAAFPPAPPPPNQNKPKLPGILRPRRKIPSNVPRCCKHLFRSRKRN